jgi:serine/threonine protein phosphatase PrpC
MSPAAAVPVEGQKRKKKSKKTETIGAEIITSDSGTTATTVLITKDMVICANIGDSRTVIMKKGGEPYALSVDHKPSDEVEKERIEKAGGVVSVDGQINYGLAVSRAIGDYDYKG